MASLVRSRLALPARRLFSSTSRAADVLSPHSADTDALSPSALANSSSFENEIDAKSSVRKTAHEAAAASTAAQFAGVQWGNGRIEDIHTPIYPTHDVPRRPGFPALADAPLHKHVNFPVPFLKPQDASFTPPQTRGEDTNAKQLAVLAALTGLTQPELRKLHNYTGHFMVAAHQTKKGKMRSFAVWSIVGSPERGLVGIGRGRGDDAGVARQNAFRRAVLSMDYVNRFEQRTVWGQGSDLVATWRATKVIIRARPPGFGLQVPHIIHCILTACGVRDASATIEGSRNNVSVMNCTLQILHGGFNPPGFGSGTGGRGRKQDKGAGMRSIKDFERQRGRFGVVVDKRL